MGGLAERGKERAVGYATLQYIGPDEQMWFLCRETVWYLSFPPPPSIILMLIRIMMDDITKQLFNLNGNTAHCVLIFMKYSRKMLIRQSYNRY